VRRRRARPSRDACDTTLAERCWAVTDTLLRLDADALLRDAMARHAAR
jgi:hypothetical protein